VPALAALASRAFDLMVVAAIFAVLG